MRHMVIFTALCLLSVFFATAPSVWAKTGLEKRHNKWVSMAVTHGEQIRFRAFTNTSSPDWNEVALCVDRLPGHGEEQYISLVISVDTPNKATVSFEDAIEQQGQVRIDEYPIHNIGYKTHYNRGERYLFAVFTYYGLGHTLVGELEAGKTLRVKLDVGDNSYYLRFPLQGFTAATRRSLLLRDQFNEYTRAKGDADYFENDEMYFDTSKQGEARYFE